MDETVLRRRLVALAKIIRAQHIRINSLSDLLQSHYDAVETGMQTQIDDAVRAHAAQVLLSGPPDDPLLQQLDSLIREIQVPVATVEKVFALYREKYFDLNVQHFRLGGTYRYKPLGEFNRSDAPLTTVHCVTP